MCYDKLSKATFILKKITIFRNEYDAKMIKYNFSFYDIHIHNFL